MHSTSSPAPARRPYLRARTSAAAAAYHDHHFNCPSCIAAGKGMGARCADGAALHEAYLSAFSADRRMA